MKKLLKEIWKEPEFWILIIFFGVISMGCIMVVSVSQRATFYRRFDEANRQLVIEMKKEIATLRIQNEKSIEDRQQLHKVLENTKKVVKDLQAEKQDEE